MIVEPRTAGDPMQEQLYWTDLCMAEISDELAQRGTPISPPTATKTGLSTTVHVMKKVYETGRAVSRDFRNHLPIKYNPILPKWNYTAIPQSKPLGHC